MFRSHHLRKSRRFLLITALVAVVALVFAAAAFAASISPYQQGAQGGDSVTWTGYWSGTSPFDVTFHFGDGSSSGLSNTYATSATFGPHKFYPCYETTYTQTLDVTDHLNLHSSYQSETIVNPGSIC